MRPQSDNTHGNGSDTDLTVARNPSVRSERWLLGFVLAVCVGTIGLPTVAHADDPPPPDRSKKTARWKAVLLEPGRGWWCRADSCERVRADCEIGGATCSSKRRAWGLSYYAWSMGMWGAHYFPTRADCEFLRAAVMKGEDETSVSSCTSVGDKREPPGHRAKLPPGKGWWCHRYRVVQAGMETSSCSRKRADCDENAKMMTSGRYASAIGRITPVSTCEAVTTAWASEVRGKDPMFMVFANEADCQASLVGDPCQRAK